VDGFDVSGLDTPWDDEEEENLSSMTQRRQTSCPSHERALPVNEIVRLLDMKEEGKLSKLFAVFGSGQSFSCGVCIILWSMFQCAYLASFFYCTLLVTT